MHTAFQNTSERTRSLMTAGKSTVLLYTIRGPRSCARSVRENCPGSCGFCPELWRRRCNGVLVRQAGDLSRGGLRNWSGGHLGLRHQASLNDIKAWVLFTMSLRGCLCPF